MKVTRGRRLLAACLLLLAISAGGATYAATTAKGVSSGTLSRISARGTLIKLPRADRRAKRLRGSGITVVTLLGTAGGENLYRVGQQSGHACYGAGRTGAKWPLGVITCRIASPYFPSPEMPILDMSGAGMEWGHGPMHFLQVAGVAADGVASIGILDENGTVIESIPVHGNIYGASSLPADAVSLQARDASDHVLTQVP